MRSLMWPENLGKGYGKGYNSARMMSPFNFGGLNGLESYMVEEARPSASAIESAVSVFLSVVANFCLFKRRVRRQRTHGMGTVDCRSVTSQLRRSWQAVIRDGCGTRC